MTLLRILIASLVLMPFCALTSGAYAAESLKAFGHDIIISGSNPETTLTVDGRVLMRLPIITLEEVAIVDSVPVVIGQQADGGNSCASTPFILSFTPDSPPRLDGPIETCFFVQYRNRGSHYEFWTEPAAGRDGELWRWEPERGLSKASVIPFKADESKGWQNLRERVVDHPADILKYKEIADQIYALLGKDLKQFTEIIGGVGSGSFTGDDYIGQACAPHMCGESEAIVFLSFHEKKPYLAWKVQGQKIVVRPNVNEWPEKAKSELRDWARKWK